MHQIDLQSLSIIFRFNQKLFKPPDLRCLALRHPKNFILPSRLPVGLIHFFIQGKLRLLCGDGGFQYLQETLVVVQQMQMFPIDQIEMTGNIAPRHGDDC